MVPTAEALYYSRVPFPTASESQVMKIYTRTGDAGETGVFGGPRVLKDDVRIEAYGTVDELNAAIGIVRASPLPAAINEVLERLQNELFVVGAQLATPSPSTKGVPMIGDQHIAALERDIDRCDEQLPPLKVFILPGGTAAAAQLHFARGVCRRAERRIVSFSHTSAESVTPQLLAYINRLGDLLFTLARATNQQAGRSDVPWQKE